MQTLGGLSSSTLAALADKLSRGSLAPPYQAVALDVVEAGQRTAVAEELEEMRAKSVAPPALAAFLQAFAVQRAREERARDEVELVWTGPIIGGAATRDAAVVAAELFARAERCVLVATYALYNGRRVLDALAQRMDEVPDLDVQIVINIERQMGDGRPDDAILEEVRRRFRDKEWPGARLPDLYYDPRALLPPMTEGRAVMHAKCVTVDDRWLLVTSANFTEAAHARNVEVGVALTNPSLATSLRRQFATLYTAKDLLPLWP